MRKVNKITMKHRLIHTLKICQIATGMMLTNQSYIYTYIKSRLNS